MNENEKCVSAEKNNNLIRTLDILLLVKKNLLKIYRKKKMSYNVSFNSFEPKNLVTLKKVKAEQKRWHQTEGAWLAEGTGRGGDWAFTLLRLK